MAAHPETIPFHPGPGWQVARIATFVKDICLRKTPGWKSGITKILFQYIYIIAAVLICTPGTGLQPVAKPVVKIINLPSLGGIPPQGGRFKL